MTHDPFQLADLRSARLIANAVQLRLLSIGNIKVGTAHHNW
jgi:hypothetical protein